MHRDLGHEDDGVSECEPWERVVADGAPCDHIVQLYQHQDFLTYAVCRFASAGFANGEGVILVSTLTHWTAFRRRLEAEGVVWTVICMPSMTPVPTWDARLRRASWMARP